MEIEMGEIIEICIEVLKMLLKGFEIS